MRGKASTRETAAEGEGGTEGGTCRRWPQQKHNAPDVARGRDAGGLEVVRVHHGEKDGLAGLAQPGLCLFWVHPWLRGVRGGGRGRRGSAAEQAAAIGDRGPHPRQEPRAP